MNYVDPTGHDAVPKGPGLGSPTESGYCTDQACRDFLRAMEILRNRTVSPITCNKDCQDFLDQTALILSMPGVSGTLEFAAQGASVYLSEGRAIAAAVTMTGTDKALAKAATKVKPLPGYTDVVIHGSSDSFGVYQGGKWIELDHRALANYIQSQGGGNGPIRLISCQTGACPNGAAQNLANKLGVEVMAPSDTVWIKGDGSLVVGADPKNATGTWNVFKPGGGQ